MLGAGAIREREHAWLPQMSGFGASSDGVPGGGVDVCVVSHGYTCIDYVLVAVCLHMDITNDARLEQRLKCAHPEDTRSGQELKRLYA